MYTQLKINPHIQDAFNQFKIVPDRYPIPSYISETTSSDFLFVTVSFRLCLKNAKQENKLENEHYRHW